MIGYNQNGYAPKKLKEVMDKENLTWRTFADPGAISAKWNAGPATYYIIDAKGLIRYKPGPVAKDIDAALEKLIQEVQDQSPPGTPQRVIDAINKRFRADRKMQDRMLAHFLVAWPAAKKEKTKKKIS